MTMSSTPPPMQEKPLPQLRRDIKIYKGPDEPDGSPTYNCLDPVKAQYFKISWAEMAILRHLQPGMTLSQLTEAVNQNTTLKVTPEEIISFFEEASQNNLLEKDHSSDKLMEEVEKKKVHPIMWLLHHYLYIRLPLFNPDKFLTKTLPYVMVLASKPAIFLYLLLTAIGLFYLIGRFDEFLKTFTYFFNPLGLVVYGLAITGVKVIHEFSHAYVAKYYRLHVPTMGVAFIVLWPVLYTDVTDGWKLNKRSQRLAISFAGVAAELVLAGLSTLGWALSSPGFLQSIFFVIASTTWISSLLVNINPAMRFDGYYLASDIMGIDNMQARSFAYTRWQLRKWFLGIRVPPPEEGLGIRRRAFMLFYSIYTWLYRLILYTVIAVFVYHEFTKVLGIILFIVEVIFFILAPFASEAKQLKKLSPNITINWRFSLTGLAVLALAIWFIVPLPHRESFPALTVPIENQIVYVPQEGKVEGIYAGLGDAVKRGQLLVRLSSKELDIEIQDTQAAIDILKAQMHVLSLNDTDKAYLPEKAAELGSEQSKLRALMQQKKLLNLVALVDGTIYEWDDTLRIGQHVSKNQVLAKIAPLNEVEVLAFVPEDQISDLAIGDTVTFRLSNSLEWLKGQVSYIARVRNANLLYPQLASVHGGDLPTQEDKDKNLIIVESYFLVRVQIKHEERPLYIGEKGYVMIRGPWKSLLVKKIRDLQALFWRESGF